MAWLITLDNNLHLPSKKGTIWKSRLFSLGFILTGSLGQNGWILHFSKKSTISCILSLTSFQLDNISLLMSGWVPMSRRAFPILELWGGIDWGLIFLVFLWCGEWRPRHAYHKYCPHRHPLAQSKLRSFHFSFVLESVWLTLGWSPATYNII